MATNVNANGNGTNRRAQVPWYLLPDPKAAFCPSCKIPCPVVSSPSPSTEDADRRVQYRQCPKCGHTCKTPVEIP